ncbi:DNA polymerase II large subunit [Candidatus Woesearchaeota archaeon]|nr:DNA polymerase II large subunit [Candidatus Woesearchaeota archaeon]|tara:strand:- start:13810 stop:17280 length:3471 start_codon:yes stop_codon:yes gene_type:complete
MPEASPEMERYFSEIDSELTHLYEVANEARSKGFDPEEKVDIPLTKNMAERVEGLLSAIKPEIIGSGLANRIEELEKKYGALTLEVAMVIADEVANNKFCKFDNKREAMQTGIRAGFAYLTIGVVSAPLEGFTELKIKKTRDGKEYFSAMFSGPIRGAGGTAMTFCLVVANYVRLKNGYAAFDATIEEQNRAAVELDDYHERVTNLQYRPSSDEIKFLIKNCPIEIDGNPTEKLEVSQFKDLPRIETNKIRGGVCLVVSMLALKAPKLWKELKRIQNEFNVDWDFIQEFIELQVKKKSKSEEVTSKIIADYTFISDLVAGRPVLTYPLQVGGFRLRYGHTRMSGYSAAGINPATLTVLDKYVATGTQLKVERPGKAAAITPCESIDGPIVKLADGSVLRFDTEVQAKEYAKEVTEILYLGDLLVGYGDFYDRNHVLVPAGYCEEWHKRELENVNLAEEEPDIKKLYDEYISFKFPSAPSAKQSILISQKLQIPLHPRYTYYWNGINPDKLSSLILYLGKSKISDSKLVLTISEEKRTLELLGVPHKVSGEFVVIEAEDSMALIASLGLNENLTNIEQQKKVVDENLQLTTLDVVKKLSSIKLRDKCGTFIGARMGRPEKAKMRKMIGNPHTLFPVGEQGGRLRSIQSALEIGKIVTDFPTYFCDGCKEDTIYKICERCDAKTTQIFNCDICGKIKQCVHNPSPFIKQAIDIKHYYNSACKKLKERIYPELIKGVRGTSNRDHIPENLLKGILRAKHNISVNKDGTTRYDMSELPITHFKPGEIGASVETIVKFGYTKDIHGKPIVSPEQIVEIKPQDVILPSSPEAVEDSADTVLLRIANFIDEALVTLYGLKPFYNVEKKQDLIGQLVIGLAPHISAGVAGRIIGFSKTQGMLAHPLFHAAMRRDADGDEACVILAMDALLNFSRQYLPDTRGAKTMDSPLVLIPRIIPAEVDDMAHRFDVAWKYPLEFYEAASEYKMPFNMKIELLGTRLDTEKQYEEIGYTHELDNINSGVLLSAYKTLPSMEEKLKGQMILAEKIRAVDSQDVAKLVVEKHLLRDIRGNLRKFSNQQFRCVKCNKKFRRPLLAGNCDNCGNRIIFTVSEGTVTKYLEPAVSLAEKYTVSPYLIQVLELTKQRIAEVFGKEKDRQEGLGKWFG